MGINFKKPVPTPEEIRRDYQVPKHVAELKAKRDQEIAITLLEMSNMKVDCVENGELAIQKFLEMGTFYYDVVLMDIRMPVKNGLDATADIRAIGGKYATEVPIIAMSANAFSEDKAKAFANGMTDYLVKPIDVDIMHDMLVKYLI